MPFILLDGYRFGFFSLDRGEPPRSHVLRGEHEAKIWLQPVAVEWNEGYNPRELNRTVGLTREYRARLLEMGHGHFDT